jgi:hypothetical protein
LSRAAHLADRLALHTPRKTDSLKRTDLRILVVFDGEHFENAFGDARAPESIPDPAVASGAAIACVTVGSQALRR